MHDGEGVEVAGGEGALRWRKRWDGTATERTKAAIDNSADGAEDRLVSYVDRALASLRQFDRFFWLGAIADTVCVEHKRSHEALFLLAARRIASTHAVPHKERASALRFLAARLRPLA